MLRGLGLFGAVLAALSVAPAARAQVNGPVPGAYGAEDGYNDDGFGWGPAYRRETNFRPAYGFYGGVERPYPYGPAADHATEIRPRLAPRPRSAQRSANHHRRARHPARAGGRTG